MKSCDVVVVVVGSGSLGMVAGAARVGLGVSVVPCRLNIGVKAGSVLAKRLAVNGDG